MRESRAPVPRWTVGCGAELRDRLLWQGTAGGDWVNCVDCTQLPDGTPVAVCGTGDGSIQVWDLATGRLAQHHDVLGGSQRPTWLACTHLPDGTPVAVLLGRDGAVRVWDLPAARMRAATGSGVSDPFGALACTVLPDGTALAMAGCEDGVRCWDVATARPYGQPVTCERPSPQVACPVQGGDNPDGTRMVVIASGGTLRVWDLVGGRFLGAPVETGFSGVQSLRCLRLADGTLLAVAGSDREWDEDGRRRLGAVRAWEVATGRPFGPPMTEHGGEINALACTELPDGTAVAVSVDRYGSVHCANLRTGLAHGPPLPFAGDGPVVACARLADGMPVVFVAETDVRLWSLAVRPSPEGLAGPVWTLGRADLPDGEVLVTAGREGLSGYTVQLWDSATGRPRGRMLAGAADDARGCVRTRDGAAAVTVTPDYDAVRLCDLESGATRDVVLAGHTETVILAACLTLAGGTPIVFTGGESVRAWRADTGQPHGPVLPLRSHSVSALQLPDGTLIVVPHDDVPQAWDATAGCPYGPRYDPTPGGWPIHPHATDCLALPDGTPVAVHAFQHTERDAGVVSVWALATGRPRGEPVGLRTTRPDVLACTRLPDGAVIAAVGGRLGRGEDYIVEIVDPLDGQKRYEITTTEPVMDLGFTGQHRLIVRTFLDITVYDLP